MMLVRLPEKFSRLPSKITAGRTTRAAQHKPACIFYVLIAGEKTRLCVESMSVARGPCGCGTVRLRISERFRTRHRAQQGDLGLEILEIC